MNIPKLEDLNCSTCTARSMKVHYEEFYNYLCNLYPGLSHSERLYWYYHNLEDYPKCSCGKQTKYINLKDGYREFCSYVCMNKSKDIQERKKQTSLKKYGVSNPMQCQEVRDKLKSTILEKYGVDNAFKSEQVKNKIKETNIKNIGVEYPMQSQTILNKMLTTRNKNTISKHVNDVDILEVYSNPGEECLYKIACPHKDCNKCSEKYFLIDSAHLYDRRLWDIEMCTNLLPIKKSHSKNTTLEIFVKRILDGHNIEYIENDRNILEGKEIDIYIPSKQIAIECNGVYWHSKYKPSYHIDKFKTCEEQGIQLLSIWEDWIKNKPEIVESIILSKLGIYNERIYARKCQVKEVNTTMSNQFCDKYHIQGRCNSKVNIGLYYNDELISLMSFSKKRGGMGNNKGVDGEYELSRFCTSYNTQVVGGAERLLQYFIKHYNPNTIYSFSSNDISNGNLYKRIGFQEITTNQCYWYISKGGKRYHRTNFMKSELVKNGADPNKTEFEIMTELGYLRIYDSGQKKWVYNIN